MEFELMDGVIKVRQVTSSHAAGSFTRSPATVVMLKSKFFRFKQKVWTKKVKTEKCDVSRNPAGFWEPAETDLGPEEKHFTSGWQRSS